MRKIKITKTIDIVFEVDDNYLRNDYSLIDFLNCSKVCEVSKKDGYGYNEYILDNNNVKNIKLYKKDTDIVNEKSVERIITEREYKKITKEIAKAEDYYDSSIGEESL